MEISIKVKVNLDDLKIGKIIAIWLNNSGKEVRKQAQANAPVDRGTLKQSIGVDPGVATSSTKKILIWSRKVPYALRREFENKKNPHTKYYMKRAYLSGKEIVKKEFDKAVAIVIKSL